MTDPAGTASRLGSPPRPVRLLLGGLITAAIVLTALVVGGRDRVPSSSPASPLEGIVVAVDAASLTDVRGFTLRISGGTTFQFKLGALENPTAFPPGHLAAHQATSSPVRVYFVEQDGARVVYRLEDALPSPAPS